MPFPSARVGFVLKGQNKDVTVRDILAYAAGLGASDAAFLDDVQPRGLRALPFQCVSLEWPGLVSLRGALSDVLSPEEARRGVHAVQDSTFHRPMVPGDRLVTNGRIVSARQVRSGVQIVCKLVTSTRNGGDVVTSSWSSSIFRDVKLDGPDVTLENPDDVLPETSSALDASAEAVTLFIPREMSHVYSECADIWNPIHTERAQALAAGLPDIILHGTATWALAGLTVLRRYAQSDVGLLKRMRGRFTGMIIPGEIITIRHARDAAGRVRFDVLNASGAPAISQGLAWVDA